jgi:hypothetical protein
MPRLSTPCSEALHRRMHRLFPHGTQAAVVRKVCELLCEKIEKDGVLVIELLISGQYNPIEGIETRGKLT